jgi:hypothetical protein
MIIDNGECTHTQQTVSVKVRFGVTCRWPGRPVKKQQGDRERIYIHDDDRIAIYTYNKGIHNNKGFRVKRTGQTLVFYFFNFFY